MSSLDFGGGDNLNSSRYYTASMPAVTDFTIVCWQQMLPGRSGGGGLIAGGGDPGAGAGLVVHLTNLETYCAVRGSGGPFPAIPTIATGDQNTLDGRSTIVVFIRRGTAVELYAGKRGVAWTAPGATDTCDTLAVPAGTWTIGKDAGSEYTRRPLGEITVFDAALSIAELNFLARGNRPSGSLSRYRLADWSFANGPTAIEIDQSGNRRHATRQGTDYRESSNLF